jgi:hypothetical protein
MADEGMRMLVAGADFNEFSRSLTAAIQALPPQLAQRSKRKRAEMHREAAICARGRCLLG